MMKKIQLIFLIWIGGTSVANADWMTVYARSFDRQKPGEKTASQALPEWESGSASGVVLDTQLKKVRKILVASSAWRSFNQGPILNLDLTAVPHDRVRVSFDLYTFGDWRGLQKATGGPQHRLMFADSAAARGFRFDTNFATNSAFQQSWPKQNPAENRAGTDSVPIRFPKAPVRFRNARRWKIRFEYATNSPKLRFSMLCGAAAGSGKPMPDFGIDNVVVSAHSTAPVIRPVDMPADVRWAKNHPPKPSGSPITYHLEKEGNVSLAVFDGKENRLIRTLLNREKKQVGSHSIIWDGRDNRGRVVAAGSYQWRSVVSQGLTGRYITTLGINPPGGENEIPSKSWVGDHLGGGIVKVDKTGVYIGSPMTEGGRMILKADRGMQKILWTRPQFYEGGRLSRIAIDSSGLYMLHPTGKLRRVNRDKGTIEAVWNVKLEDEVPVDLAAGGGWVVLSYPQHNRVRWLSTKDGKLISEQTIPVPRSLASRHAGNGETYVSSGGAIFLVKPGVPGKKVAAPGGAIGAIDFDPERKELWIVLDGHRIVRFDSNHRRSKSYGDQPRRQGPFDPTRFSGVYDIAADRKGGFFVGEPGTAPRRIAHISGDGELIDQWFGGMSFYVNATVDPENPSVLYGIAPEGWVNVYRVDFESGRWSIEACYQTGRLGDSLFPFTGAFKAIRRNGKVFLYHRSLPAVIRLDPEQRKAVPVAIAGTVRNRGRSFIQFAGSGRDGYPKPWVAAAEHHGFKDLKSAPKYYSWADSNGNGQFEPNEFRFYANAKTEISFHNAGDFKSNGDFIGSGKVNAPHALVHLPVKLWEGPEKNAPRWDWGQAKTVGRVQADHRGYGSPRGLSVGKDDSISVAYQAGIMIREHGQYEGGGWPEAAMKGSRVLAFDKEYRPIFEVGRQSKSRSEANQGVLFYPMQTARGPRGSVIVNDQTQQPAQVWTHDGLFVGGVLDQIANDRLPAGFYQLHGDDNQGCTLIAGPNGKTYWLMPYQGHNRLFEIGGWDWQRSTGQVSLTSNSEKKQPTGTGLSARYEKENKTVLETREPPIYYERFAAERHSGKVAPHYKVTWRGWVEAPFSDRYQFRALLGKSEQVCVWIDGKVVYTAGLDRAIQKKVDLTARHRHRIRIEYINPDGRAELNLLWSSRVLDPGRIPKHCLFPATDRD